MSVELLLVGGGKMGAAMLAGWLKGSLSTDAVLVIEPFAETRAALEKSLGVTCVADAADIPDSVQPKTIVLAVKPQMMDAALPAYVRFAGPDCLFLSIAAGKTIDYFEDTLGTDAVIVRAMPNTPAAVGRGITVGFPNPQVSTAQRDWADTLLRAVGEVAWVEDEGMIDAVTALSGGGPAYVFLLVEVMARAGIAAGLPDDLAMRLARVTVAGAGELLHQASEDAATLRQNVTSPGGTTAEALKILMADDALQPLMTEAIAQATRRSRELAG
ncbi:MAG: pyrroline-5-carboxylate reductase [Rhodospirillales bacterium]